MINGIYCVKYSARNSSDKDKRHLSCQVQCQQQPRQRSKAFIVSSTVPATALINLNVISWQKIIHETFQLTSSLRFLFRLSSLNSYWPCFFLSREANACRSPSKCCPRTDSIATGTWVIFCKQIKLPDRIAPDMKCKIFDSGKFVLQENVTRCEPNSCGRERQNLQVGNI